MSKSLRDEIRTILALGVVALAFAPAAFAQEQTAKDDEEATSEADFEEIVVTGSRIRRTEFTSPAPVTVITTERSQLAGLLSTEEILTNSTAGRGQQDTSDAYAGFIQDGGPGVNTISLRGLGANRTLVLVNGRRWSASGVQGQTNNVDLTAIPSSIIGRIEILKDGASSIYGADAIAGVVNIITKESYDGLQLNGTGQATHDGGGERYTVDVTWGTVSDRGSFSISGRYEEQKELVRTDRYWSRCDTIQRWTDQPYPAPDGEFRGDGVIDNRDPVTGEPLCFGDVYGFGITALGYLRYEPSLTDMNDTSNPFYDPRVALYGNLTGGDFSLFTRAGLQPLANNSWPLQTSNPTSGCPNAGPTCQPVLYSGNDAPYYNDFSGFDIAHMVYPRKSYSVTSLGQLDFDLGAGTTTAFYEAFWNRRETRSSFGWQYLYPDVMAFTEDGQNFHPYNPFGPLELFCGPEPCGLGNSQPVVLTWNLLNPNQYIDIDRYNLFAGLKGDLTSRWDYEVVAGYGRSEGTYEKEQFLADRVEAAVNRLVIRPDGSVTCSDGALADFPDCVPLNLYAEDALLRGIIPADALTFIKANTKGKTVYESKTISAYATGPLFDIPAGPVNAVFGGEYREESINDVPDPEAQANNLWGFSTAGITKGTEKITELFTEIELPLLSNRPFAENLFISGSLRWTDYESYGDDTTYRVALNYQITPQVLLRSTYGTSFRAPDLYELFLADRSGFVAGADPCSAYGSRYQPGDTVYDNCLAQGLDPETYRATSTTQTLTGGAADLEAETADSLTIGLVFTPSDLDLSFALDYYDIEIEDTVESPSASYITNRCYNSPGLTDPFCSRIGPRDPNNGNQITSINTSYINIGAQRTRGYDFNFLYEHQFEAGSLTIDGIVTYLDKQTIELFGDVSNLEGRWGFPRLSARTQVRYDWRDWRVGWFMDFIGESEEDPIRDWGVLQQDRQNRTPNLLYHTLSLRYAGSNWEAIGTVRNVFDKDPPYVGNGHNNEGAGRYINTIPAMGYDLLGRSYVLQLSYEF